MLRRRGPLQGPPAVPAPRLARLHVHRAEDAPLLALLPDAHQMTLHVRRDGLVLERLALHDVTPVARRVADREQDRLVLLACARERLLAPRMPVHRVVLVLEEVGRGLLREPVGHRVRGYPEPALGSLSSARLIFPLAVFGSDSANSTMRGYLYGAVSALTWSCSSWTSSSPGSTPARSTTTARTTAPRS